MFDLTESHIRRIIFAMENQKTNYVVAVDTGTVLRRDRVPGGDVPSPDFLSPKDAYLDIPPWSSGDGFQMMSAFAATVQDPEIRAEIQEVLSGSSGVFRRFREVLHRREVLVTRWNLFKFNTMRERIVEWYNGAREIFGLDPYEAGVDEETDDLALQSFSIELTDAPPVAMLEEFDRQGYIEARPGAPLPLLQTMYRQSRSRLPSMANARSAVFMVTTPTEEIGGFLWAVWDVLVDGSRMLTVEQLYVIPAFRGMGIGSALLDSCIRYGRQNGDGKVVVRGGSACDQLKHRFGEYDFLVVERTVILG